MNGSFTTRLSVPALSRYGRVARLAAAGVAAEAGMGVDDVEDLRVAVNELFSLMVDDCPLPTDEVELEMQETANGSVEVRGERRMSVSPGDDAEPLELAREILSVVVDDFDFDTAGDVRRFVIRKSARMSETA